MDAERNELIKELEEKARRIRVHVVWIAGMSDCHTGGSMSIAEILAALYFRVMRVDPKNPKWAGRDYFILSKGHCVPGLDAALAMRGFFPEEMLTTHLERDNWNSGASLLWSQLTFLESGRRITCREVSSESPKGALAHLELRFPGAH